MVHGPTGLKNYSSHKMKTSGKDKRCFWNFGDTSRRDEAAVVSGEEEDKPSMDLSFVPWHQTRHCYRS
jgi:hypothetical protein